MSDPDPLVRDAEAWLAQDPDPTTREELRALLQAATAEVAGAMSELAARFSARLEFGTAGLRGELGAGPTRMNRVLVGQAAAGLAAYLLEREAAPSVVIGYDGRHNSERFARDTAELMQGAGVRATLLPRMLPTPVLAFAVRHLDASAGVMVTASHNPARDNGYKVYLGGADEGSQIVSPADAEIAAHILRVAHGSLTELPRRTDYALAEESLIAAYVGATSAVATATAPLEVVYTPMHGVGRETALAVLAAAGFSAPHVVAQQAEPDPDFPTVAFPNPEEAGALDLSMELARAVGAELIIANDPDADRVSVAIPDASLAAGWRQLSGNEVGWLLGWQAARRASAAGAQGSLARSLVSSPALGAVAERTGLTAVETLTGFKWISRAPELLFGYEEALGYLVNPGTIRDKDGISAMVAVLSLAAELRERGATIADHLAEFADAFGGFASGQISIRVSDLSERTRISQRLRDEPPTAIGGLPVVSAEDFETGVDGFPAGDILRYRVEGGRVIVRPSGTEPKLKCYLDAWSEDGTATERLAAAHATLAALEAGMRELLG